MTIPRLTDLNREPDESIIEALEELLEQAHAGELRGLFVLANYPDRLHPFQAGQWSERDAVWACEVWKRRILEESDE